MQRQQSLIGSEFPGVTTIFFCHDGEGNLFLSKRSPLVRDEQGAWEPGAGGLELGLTAIENVCKELQEEYDAAPKRIDFIGYLDILRRNYDTKPTHWVGLCFAVLVERNGIRVNEPEMIDQGGWFTLRDLPAPLHSQMRPFLEKYGGRLEELMGGGTGASLEASGVEP
jgi:ADP-ribose pyrophosphatase YjhB (NUDIX family)